MTLDVPTPPAEPADGGTLGVDRGIVNRATDSDGETFRGAAIAPTRQRMGALRAALPTRGTKRAKRAKRAKRHLKRLSGREARFRRATNHCISKHMVAKAQHSHQRIAREDLRHMRSRTERTVRKSQRQRPSSCSWAFCQLRAFSADKAALAGVPRQLVDPRATSRTCSRCGHGEQANRKTQAAFVCQNPVCGFAARADWNAAVTISRAAPSDSLSSRPVDRLDTQAVA